MSLLLLVFAVTTVHFVGYVVHNLVLAWVSCSRFGLSLTCDEFMVLSCSHVFYWFSRMFSKCIAHSHFLLSFYMGGARVLLNLNLFNKLG